MLYLGGLKLFSHYVLQDAIRRTRSREVASLARSQSALGHPSQTEIPKRTSGGPWLKMFSDPEAAPAVQCCIDMPARRPEQPEDANSELGSVIAKKGDAVRLPGHLSGGFCPSPNGVAFAFSGVAESAS